MQAPGLYWLNIDRQDDALILSRQVIAHQDINQRVALIGCEIDLQMILVELNQQGPLNIPFFTLPAERNAITQLPEDLMRTLRPRNRLIIFLLPAASWQLFSEVQLQRWLSSTASWLQQQNCTLLLLSQGAGSSQLHHRLQPLHRQINGLASLQWQQDQANYHVAWWSNEQGVSAGAQLILTADAQGWRVKEQLEPFQPQSGSDDYLYLAEKSVLEGAPPLSENWQLYETNDALFQAAYNSQAATLIFSLYSSEQTEQLARNIHSLRRRRGNAIKLVVREMAPGLRYSDERLLMACGVGLIVPNNAPLSRFLTMLEGIQGLLFSRHVPEDISGLLDAMQPLQLKGYIPPTRFCQAVLALMDNHLLPEEGKGVLVALRPVPGLRATQALTLCNIRRYGDLVTVAEKRLYLFLSACRINDLEIALTSIFRLPVNEAFSNRLVWFQERQIAAEIRQLQLHTPSAWRENSRGDDDKRTNNAAQPDVLRRRPIAVQLQIGKGEIKP